MFPTKLRRLPREAVAPGLELDDGGKRIRRERSVLLLAELPSFQRVRMKERGALITSVEDVPAAVAALADNSYDAAVVDMRAPGGGTALVKCIKGGVGSTSPTQRLFETAMAGLRASAANGMSLDEWTETLDGADRVAPAGIAEHLSGIAAVEHRARLRHRLTPFFLVMEGEPQYAIVVDPPEHSYLEDGKGLSLADAVMCLDVGKLLLRGPAMA